MRPSPAEATAHCRQLAQAGPHRAVVRTTTPVADRRSLRPDRTTRPPLAHPMQAAPVRRGFPPGCGRLHFFVAMSFSMALSSIASASNFFSQRLSSSSDRSRLASDTSSLPYLAFHL